MRSASKKKTTVIPFQPPRSDAADRLAAAVRTLHELKVDTITEARIFCEAATQPEATLSSIVKKVEMPFSTASRVAYSLLERGLLRYAPHPTDRRKKIVTANVELLA